MTRYTNLVSTEFKATARTWKRSHQPKFNPKVSVGKNKITGRVWTTAKIYSYVSDGTKRHPIPKAGTANLRFRSGYKAKSSPNRIPSGSGGSFGNYVHRRQVMHPGIKARKFDTQIKDDTESRFGRFMNNAMENAVLEVS